MDPARRAETTFTRVGWRGSREEAIPRVYGERHWQKNPIAANSFCCVSESQNSYAEFNLLRERKEVGEKNTHVLGFCRK
jgi:hypothetical protein